MAACVAGDREPGAIDDKALREQKIDSCILEAAHLGIQVKFNGVQNR